MIQTLTFPDREAWLAARRQWIGSSDAGVLWGRDCCYASQSPYALWANKKHGIEVEFSKSEKLRLRKGVALEPVIRDAASEELCVALQVDPPHSFRVNDELPGMAASLDSWYGADDGVVVVELKWVSESQRRDWEDGGSPLKFLVQVSHQMSVLDSPRGILIGMCDDEIMVRHVARDREFEKQHIAKCQEFWRLVESNTPPQVDASDATTDAIKNRFKREQGPRIEAPAWVDDVTRELAELDETAKATASAIEERKNRLRDFIGNAEGMITETGVEWTWTTTHYQAEKVPRPARDQRTLRRVKGKRSKA